MSQQNRITQRKRNRKLFLESLGTRRVLAANCFHNDMMPEDVNDDQSVSPLDALMIINELNHNGGARAEGEAADPSTFLDVNADEIVSPMDALRVINTLNAEGEDDTDDVEDVDEVDDDDTEDNDTGDDNNDEASEETEIGFEAILTGASATTAGEAELEMETEDGVTVTEFEVEIEQAAADTTYDVFLDDVLIGQLATDAAGAGEFELSSDPDQGELGLPANFPQASEGSTVRIGDILSGVLAVEIEDDEIEDDDTEDDDLDDDTEDDDLDDDTEEGDAGTGSGSVSENEPAAATLLSASTNSTAAAITSSASEGEAAADAAGTSAQNAADPEGGTENSSDDESIDDDGDDELDDDIDEDQDDDEDESEEDDDDDSTEIEFTGVLSGDGTTAVGEAEFELETENGVTTMEFEVEIEGATPDTTFDVVVDGVTVGQITTDADGNAELEFSSDLEEDELSFPANFPTIGEGAVIQIGNLLSGTLAAEV